MSRFWWWWRLYSVFLAVGCLGMAAWWTAVGRWGFAALMLGCLLVNLGTAAFSHAMGRRSS